MYMAATMKFTYGLLMLSFVWLLTAQTFKVDDNTTTEITTIFKTLKEIVSTSDKATTTKHGDVGGIRKMALHKVMRLQKAKAQGVTTTTESNSKVSASSNQAEGTAFDRQNSLEFDKQTVPRFSSAQFDEAEGFVAFSADYSAPRRHPPKNN